ncbi:MAG: hypothetical protein RL383_1287 [Actinomycetota bacterium]|jgi:hypothetical protein
MTTNDTEREHTMNDAISRRTLLLNGGAAAAAGVILAACGGEHSGLARVGEAPATTALPEAHVSDVVLLRTAESVEQLALEALGSDVMMSKAGGTGKAAIEQFLGTHRANVAALAPLVKQNGGESVTAPNTRMMKNYVTTATALIDESDTPDTDVLVFVHALEGIVAATYQAFVAWTSEPSLRAAMMTLAVAPSENSAATAQLLRSGTAGIVPGLDENGAELVATLPSAFGPLSAYGITIGKVNEAGARTTINMETPSLNSLEY